MANSNFKVFAESVADLNVMSDAEYSTDTQRINGVVPGLAPANLHNKLYKQATIMAAALAQVLVEQGQDALDSDYAALVAAIKKSLVLSLNGEKPDKNGNIQKNFVYSVEGKKPDADGNVALNIDYLNAFSFVGSVVITKENINPGTKMGGTWQLLEAGRYIRSAGGNYAGGATGGSDSFNLTIDNLPSHSHDITIYGNGAHYHGSWGEAYDNPPFGIYPGTVRNLMGSNGGRDYDNYAYCTTTNGNHNHQAEIKSTGNDKKVKFEPSYLCLYFWVRTA